jgi:hypothetical protein
MATAIKLALGPSGSVPDQEQRTRLLRAEDVAEITFILYDLRHTQPTTSFPVVAIKLHFARSECEVGQKMLRSVDTGEQSREPSTKLGRSDGRC